MSREAALWSAPLGVAVTHSPNVGSRSGCRAQALGSHELWVEPWEPESREGKRVALCWNRVAPSTGQLGETPCFCVCLHHEGCHRCAGECPGQLLPVEVRHGRKRMKVPVPDTSPLCQRCSKPFLEAVPTIASCNKIYFWTVRRGRPGLGLPVFKD